MGTYRPSSWPQEVSLPRDPRFRESALAWLWTLVPDSYHDYPVLRDHPVAVVALARHMLIARYEAARSGYRTVHVELAKQLPPHHLTDVRAIYKEEGHRLLAAARSLDLVDRAMRGEVLTPKSAAPAPWFPPAF